MALEVDYLDECPIKVPNQNFALISFVSADKDAKQRHEEQGKLALKIRGVFETREAAEHHLKRLMKADNLFDVYLVDMYRWLLLPPESTENMEEQYQEEFLNELIGQYKKNQELAKQHFEERKQAMLAQQQKPALEDGAGEAGPSYSSS